MKYLLVASLIFLSALAYKPGIAQSNDTATERAQLANQRILLEAESRARDEEERLQQATEQAGVQEEAVARSNGAQVQEQSHQPTLADQEKTTDQTASEANPSRNKVSGGDTDLSRMLEQLRTLGQLRDAGYVTEEEFKRIKGKILDSQ